MKIRSSIQSSLIKKQLFRGSLLSSLGAVLLLFTGALLPPALLSFLGLPAMIVSSLLIGFGLLPYRKLARLEMKPHELLFDGSSLFFSMSGKKCLKIPLTSIEKMEFVEKENLYGIALHLKKNSDRHIQLLQKTSALEALVAQGRSDFGADLFFPYFSKRGFTELEEAISYNSLENAPELHL